VVSSRRPLSPADVADRLRAHLGDDLLGFADAHGHAVATIAPARYRELMTVLRDDAEFDCDYLDFTTAVDYPEQGHFELATHVYSTSQGHHVRVKVRIPRDEARCDTISDIYPGANWHERETWELFGIVFEGHPHLVKLVLPEPFEGYPLRKDFELMSRVAKPWPGAAEGEEAEEE
jgi:NADH-quinone oxidoreductase subunit C